MYPRRALPRGMALFLDDSQARGSESIVQGRIGPCYIMGYNRFNPHGEVNLSLSPEDSSLLGLKDLKLISQVYITTGHS